MYVVHVINDISANKQQLDDYEILKEFRDVFLEEIPGLPPKKDIDFTIDLVPREILVSKSLIGWTPLN